MYKSGVMEEPSTPGMADTCNLMITFFFFISELLIMLTKAIYHGSATFVILWKMFLITTLFCFDLFFVVFVFVFMCGGVGVCVYVYVCGCGLVCVGYVFVCAVGACVGVFLQ